MVAIRVIDESENADQVWDETASEHVAAGSTGKKLVDTLTEVAGLNGDAMRGTDSAALAATALSNVVWTDVKAGYLTGDTYVRLGTPAGASVSVDIAAIKTAVNAIPTTPTLQATWTDAKAAFLDEAISAAKTLTIAERTAIRKSVCLTGDTASSIGKILFELNVRATEARLAHLNADITSRSSHNAAAIWSVGTRELTDKAGFALDSGEYTNIWNNDISAYTGAKAGTYLKTLYDDWLNGGRLDLLLDACSTHNAGDVLDVNVSAYSGVGYAGTYLKAIYDNLEREEGLRQDKTIASSKSYYIPLGEGRGYNVLTIDGSLRVDGEVLCDSLSIDGTLIINGKVEVN